MLSQAAIFNRSRYCQDHDRARSFFWQYKRFRESLSRLNKPFSDHIRKYEKCIVFSCFPNSKNFSIVPNFSNTLNEQIFKMHWRKKNDSDAFASIFIHNKLTSITILLQRAILLGTYICIYIYSAAPPPAKKGILYFTLFIFFFRTPTFVYVYSF